MMSLEPYQRAGEVVDALVINEGERSFREIISLRDWTTSALMAVPGLALPSGDGWVETPARPLVDLNELPNPYRMNLVPHGLGVLQTYRGCPFTCTFCEWGTLESPRRVLDVPNLCSEFAGIANHEVGGANPGRCRSQPQCACVPKPASGCPGDRLFARRQLICEVYPAKVTQEHLDFLASVGSPYVGVGLQSFDNNVLAQVERPDDETRFEDNLQRLTEVASVAVEIIMGLPGDSPKTFRATRSGHAHCRARFGSITAWCFPRP